MAEKIEEVSDQKQRRGAVLLVTSGIASAFGVAACCALPILFATAGIGTAWLTGIATISAPYRNVLMIVSLISLLASTTLLWRIQQNARRRGNDTACTPIWLRLGLLVGVLIGAGLLVAGYMYV